MKQRHKEWVLTWVSDHRRIVYIVGGILLLVIVLQALYPTDRALPFSKLGGDMVGFATDQDVAKKLQADYGTVNVTTTIRDKTIKTPIAESGLVTDNKTILSGLGDYAWYLRIIPFSSIIKGALTNQPVTLTTDGPKFSVYATERLKECEVAPKNAGVIVREAEVVLDPAVDGQKCTADDLKNQLIWHPLEKSGKTMNIKTIAVKPARSDKDVQPLLEKAQAIAEYKITLVVAGKTYAIDKPTLASWLAFPEDPATKEPTVGLNDEAVKAYLTSIQKDVYVAPGVTLVTTKDSLETARVVGRSGQGIDQAKTVEAIRTQVLTGDGTVTASLAVLPPSLKYDRSYSKTPEGLQALINDIVKDKGDFAISVRKLGDTGVHANGDKTYHPASTYKLFVAYSVLKRVDANQMSLGQTTSGGQTLAQCLDNMIVNSDNACAEWFGQAIGWSTLTNEARAIGASKTVLSRPFVSTPNDQALLLQKLESNQLALTEPSRERLLSAMKRQVFRKGIPAGVGVPVANKVGFLDGYLHDSAIVYSPGGVYILVIYSNGSSWTAIADAAKQIHAQLQ
ncbi:MAG: serine hydrolase [Candidatus Saccharimonadales bacterium]